jgi:hypothetical protein
MKGATQNLNKPSQNLKPQLTIATSSRTNDNTKGGIPTKGNESNSFTLRRFIHQPTLNETNKTLHSGAHSTPT